MVLNFQPADLPNEHIEIIGAAINRILKKNEIIEIPDSRKIVSARNRIIHGYYSISDHGIIIKNIPTLKSEVESLLS